MLYYVYKWLPVLETICNANRMKKTAIRTDVERTSKRMRRLGRGRDDDRRVRDFMSGVVARRVNEKLFASRNGRSYQCVRVSIALIAIGGIVVNVAGTRTGGTPRAREIYRRRTDGRTTAAVRRGHVTTATKRRGPNKTSYGARTL